MSPAEIIIYTSARIIDVWVFRFVLQFVGAPVLALLH